ncbi:hypothetical protein L484_024174 [Morus notabilis]|uniref:Uncharacterized protein n=1 Tax=Morus notabilis TaxID=981085 RepID=W9SBF8_9ROSA|nr:hypothetical protein L484_024174 [Morus notabilis]
MSGTNVLSKPYVRKLPARVVCAEKLAAVCYNYKADVRKLLETSETTRIRISGWQIRFRIG